MEIKKLETKIHVAKVLVVDLKQFNPIKLNTMLVISHLAEDLEMMKNSSEGAYLKNDVGDIVSYYFNVNTEKFSGVVAIYNTEKANNIVSFIGVDGKAFETHSVSKLENLNAVINKMLY